MPRTLIGLERQIRRDLDRLPPAARAELLHVLLQPDYERVATIGEYWANPKTRAFADLPIECEENSAARAILGGMLRRPNDDESMPVCSFCGRNGRTVRRVVAGQYSACDTAWQVPHYAESVG
jgi:hypothetical protein